MKIGSTYYEKTVPIDQGLGHLERLAEWGFSHVEFSPHEKLLSKTQLRQLHKKAQSLHLTTAFHSPDFLDPVHFATGYYGADASVKNSYLRMLHELSGLDLSTASGHPLVIHGAQEEHAAASGQNAKTSLYRFFDWLANELIRQNLPLQLCLENSCALDEQANTQTPSELLEFFTQFKGAPIYLCFDLPHWWRQCQLINLAPDYCFEDDFKPVMDQIIYGHLHGIDSISNQSHVGINSEHLSYFDFVKRFSLKKTQINFNLEIFESSGFENFSTYETLLKSQFQLIVEKCRN